MVNRSSILPIEKINFFPYAEDVAYLRAKYGSGAPSSSRMGYGPAMREIIHAAVKKLREKERMRIDLQSRDWKPTNDEYHSAEQLPDHDQPTKDEYQSME